MRTAPLLFVLLLGGCAAAYHTPSDGRLTTKINAAYKERDACLARSVQADGQAMDPAAAARTAAATQTARDQGPAPSRPPQVASGRRAVGAGRRGCPTLGPDLPPADLRQPYPASESYPQARSGPGPMPLEPLAVALSAGSIARVMPSAADTLIARGRAYPRTALAPAGRAGRHGPHRQDRLGRHRRGEEAGP